MQGCTRPARATHRPRSRGGRALPQCQFGRRKIRQDLGRRRRERCCLAQRIRGGLAPPCRVQNECEIRPRIGRLRLDRERCTNALGGFRQLAGLEQNDAGVVQRRCVVRIGGEHGVVAHERFAELALLVQTKRAVELLADGHSGRGGVVGSTSGGS
jgi:hypothetical protein